MVRNVVISIIGQVSPCFHHLVGLTSFPSLGWSITRCWKEVKNRFQKGLGKLKMPFGTEKDALMIDDAE